MKFSQHFKQNILSWSQQPWVFIIAAVFLCTIVFFVSRPMEGISRFGDEKYYIAITANFEQIVRTRALDEYRLQRILPTALAHYVIKIFRIPMKVKSITGVFTVFNIILCALIAWIWTKIISELKISAQGLWLGFLAIFVNFHILKYVAYTQVLTDLFGYCLSFLLVLFFLKNNLLGLIIATFLGAFTWPTMMYTGMLLILFAPDKNGDTQSSKRSRILALSLTALFSFFLTIRLIQVIRLLRFERIYQTAVFSMGANRPLLSVIYLSSAITVGYVAFCLFGLFNSDQFLNMKYWKKKISLKRCFWAVALVISVKTFLHVMAASQNARPLDYLIFNLLTVSIMQPAAFLVSHVLFFGPILIFLPFMIKPFTLNIKRYGAGLILCLCLCVIFSLDSESRKMMNVIPFVLPFLIQSMDRLRLKPNHFVILGILSLIYSKIWMPFTSQPWNSSALEFPAQFYYMTMGPWMAHRLYAIQAGLAVLTAWMVYFFIIRKVNPSAG